MYVSLMLAIRRIKKCRVSDVFDSVRGDCFKGRWVAGRLYLKGIWAMRDSTQGLGRKC